MLQYAFTSTRHPSIALRAWEGIYTILGVIRLISVLVYVRDWARKRRTADSSRGYPKSTPVLGVYAAA